MALDLRWLRLGPRVARLVFSLFEPTAGDGRRDERGSLASLRCRARSTSPFLQAAVWFDGQCLQEVPSRHASSMPPEPGSGSAIRLNSVTTSLLSVIVTLSESVPPSAMTTLPYSPRQSAARPRSSPASFDASFSLSAPRSTPRTRGGALLAPPLYNTAACSRPAVLPCRHRPRWHRCVHRSLP